MWLAGAGVLLAIGAVTGLFIRRRRSAAKHAARFYRQQS
jgi:hypothetical protein